MVLGGGFKEAFILSSKKAKLYFEASFKGLIFIASGLCPGLLLASGPVLRPFLNLFLSLF
jgi:hypothetical protein